MIVIFNGFGSTRSIRNYEMEVSSSVTVAQLRQQLKSKLSTGSAASELINLLDSCAFAGNEQVFSEDYLVDQPQIINILPPVCGG